MENQPLKRTDVQVLGVNFLVYGAVVPKQMSKEELQNPEFWVNVAQKFQMGSEIRITDANCSFMARAFVTYINSHDVRLHVIEYHVFESAEVVDAGDHYIKQRGVHKWCIMRKDNPDAIQQNIATKLEAEEQLDEYLKTLAR